MTARLDTAPLGAIRAGDTVTLTGTVKNEGTAPAFRVHARVQTDDGVFEDTELLFGKIAPGETRTFEAKLVVPKDSVDRLDRLGLEVREAKNAPATVIPATLRIEARPRPVFAYAYHLVDAGNGDGLVQRREKYKLRLTIKNSGQGTAAETTALLRNASGDGVVIDKSRFELGELAPGQSRTVEFPFAVTPRLDGEEMAVEVLMYDGVLGTQASEKLRFPVRPAVAVEAQRGVVEVRARATTLRAGASADSTPIGTAAAKARFTSLGVAAGWVKVDLGEGRFGFAPAGEVGKTGGAATSAWTPTWHSTPPALTVQQRGLETTAATYTVGGSVVDDTHVEDVYIYVSNSSAKIDGRKVFYRSNRGGKNDKQLDFQADVPLWPGSNQIMVVARENTDVRAVRMMYVYREATKTAAVSP